MSTTRDIVAKVKAIVEQNPERWDMRSAGYGCKIPGVPVITLIWDAATKRADENGRLL